MKDFARRLTQKQHQQMKKLYEEGYAINFIARKFCCRQQTVWNCVFQSSIPVIPSKNILLRNIKCSKLTKDNVTQIRTLARSGLDSVAISKMYKISQTTTLNVIRGKTFRWIKGWIRPDINSKFIYIKPLNITLPKPKSDRFCGAKAGSKKTVPRGYLLKLAAKHKRSTSTICRWMKKGKIK